MTPKQREVLRYVEDYQSARGYAPTLQEIADHLRVTKVTVLGHLRSLERGKHIRRSHYRRRAIEVIRPLRRLPLVGRIVAGRPLESYPTPGDLDLLESVRRTEETFALEVRGDSMIGDHIRDGDYVIVERRATARDGETVVALLENGETTLKKLFRRGSHVFLQPAHPDMEPIEADSVRIQGVVVGLYRKMR